MSSLKTNFLGVCYLLLFGELPGKSELYEVPQGHQPAHDGARADLGFYTGFRRDAHPMAVILGVVGALSAFYPDSTGLIRTSARSLPSPDREDADDRGDGPQVYVGQPFIYPRNNLDYRRIPAHVLRGPGGRVQVNPVFAKAMDRSSWSTPTTSKMLRPRRFVWRVRRAPIRSPASRRGLLRFGGRARRRQRGSAQAAGGSGRSIASPSSSVA